MFGNIDPKKIQSMMKQMGIAQENIDAERVIIEKSNNQGRIIIENPSVLKVKMSGQENFQVSGDVREENEEQSEKEESEESKLEEDIQTIVEQTGADKEIVAIELEKNQGDIAETIISLSKQKSKKEKKK
jgi:alpha-NAC-related protein